MSFLREAAGLIFQCYMRVALLNPKNKLIKRGSGVIFTEII